MEGTARKPPGELEIQDLQKSGHLNLLRHEKPPLRRTPPWVYSVNEPLRSTGGQVLVETGSGSLLGDPTAMMEKRIEDA